MFRVCRDADAGFQVSSLAPVIGDVGNMPLDNLGDVHSLLNLKIPALARNWSNEPQNMVFHGYVYHMDKLTHKSVL